MSARPAFSRRLHHWINDRFPLSRMLHAGLHEEIPGGTRFSYTLGSACLFLLTIQVLTGVWQMFYYVPTVDHAYSSLNYLRLQVPFGWLVHGMHYWGAHMFTVVVGLHVMRVFLWGAYKKPRELVWLAGVVLLILTALFMFTGPVLPWDKKGYWAGQVGLGMAASVPVVGPLLQDLLQGASKMGQLALMRLYVLHVAIIPFLTVLFVMVHLIAFRKFGSVGPWDPRKRTSVGYFWPEQLFKDIVVGWALFVLLVGLIVYVPPPVSGLADPMDTLYTPKPEWPFLFLYEALKYFPGPLEPVGVAGVPTVIILMLLSLPFVDKSPERNPARRLFVVLCGVFFVVLVLGLTLIGAVSRPPMAEQDAAAVGQTPGPGPGMEAVGAEREPLPPQPEAAFPPASQALSGERLFKSLGCMACHNVDGNPQGKQGPDLALSLGPGKDREWLRVQIVAPQKHNPHTIMPPYGNLPADRLNLLLDYLETLARPDHPSKIQARQRTEAMQTAMPAAQAGPSAEIGEQVYNSQGCVVCHDLTGQASRKQGPDLVMSLSRKNVSADWLRDQLIAPQKHNPLSIMPSYARLGEDSINSLVAFLQTLTTRPPPAVPAAESGAGSMVLPADESSQQGLGEAVHIIGNREHGEAVFRQSCIMCHGPQGNIRAPQFRAPQGVPGLSPIRPQLRSPDANEFASRVDVYIQHGIANSRGGPDMPAFGDTHLLTQAQIADVEAYVLFLNGVDRAKIIHPGVEPKEFFRMVLIISLLIVALCGIYSLTRKHLFPGP